MATELTPQQKRQQSTKALVRNVQYGLTNGGMEGAMMGFMDFPYMSRPGATHGNIGGPWQKMWPGGVDPSMRGTAGGNTPSTGGDLPPTGTNAPAPLPGDKFKQALIPEWWKEWYRTQGQYGGVPPVEGLL